MTLFLIFLWACGAGHPVVAALLALRWFFSESLLLARLSLSRTIR